MDDDPPYRRGVSLHLSRVLDEIGLNNLTVRKRRGITLIEEQLFTVSLRLRTHGLSVYHFGSQTEGSTTLGLHSDLDTLICCPYHNVIQDWSDWQEGKINLMMLQDKTAPGYCHLQLLNPYEPKAIEIVLTDNYTYEGDRVLLKNTWLKTSFPEHQLVLNGPALSTVGSRGFMDADYVVALHCTSWPMQAEGFIRRHRRHGWPSHNLLQEAVKHGVFLVPVGYKLSPTEPLEWRLSSSLAERCLMFSLNIVHIKCYVVLKMLVKTYIEPRARKCISSYHCKTAILYGVENTVAGFWRDDNLLQCVALCLKMLLSWVTDGFCPQFVIAEANLFAGKVTAQNRSILQSVLKELIISNGRALLLVQIDDIGRKLQEKLSTEPSTVPVLDSGTTLRLIITFECYRHRTLNFTMRDIILKENNSKLVPVIHSVYKTIVLLKSGRVGPPEKYELQATELLLENLSRWLGSLMAAFSLSNEIKVPRMAMQMLHEGVEYNIASMLKLASVFFNMGLFRKVEIILCVVENHVSSNTVCTICGCYNNKVTRTNQECVCNIYVLGGRKTRAKLFANCVRFSHHEMHCAPPALRNEFFRSMGEDPQRRDKNDGRWMALAVVDCLPFQYYLQYITYRQLGKRDLQRQALNNLAICLDTEVDTFGHPETAWNLFGQCYELEHDLNEAVVCYKTSLNIRPRNNAANWHLQNIDSFLLHPLRWLLARLFFEEKKSSYCVVVCVCVLVCVFVVCVCVVDQKL